MRHMHIRSIIAVLLSTGLGAAEQEPRAAALQLPVDETVMSTGVFAENVLALFPMSQPDQPVEQNTPRTDIAAAIGAMPDVSDGVVKQQAGWIEREGGG